MKVHVFFFLSTMICSGVLLAATACGEKNDAVKNGDDLLAGTGMSLEDFGSFAERSAIGNVPENLIGNWYRSGEETVEHMLFEADGTGAHTDKDGDTLSFEWALDGDILTLAWADDPDNYSCVDLKATARNIAVVGSSLYMDVFTFIRLEDEGAGYDGCWVFVYGESNDWSDCYADPPDIQIWQDRTTLQITGDSYSLIYESLSSSESDNDEVNNPVFGELIIGGDHLFVCDLTSPECAVLYRADENVLVFIGWERLEDLDDSDFLAGLRSMTEWIRE